MQEGQLLMTQADRDRLVTLKKAKKKIITQRVAAEELGLSTRQVKRLLYAMKKRGDKAVIHGLRGKPSNRRIEEDIKREAVKILSTEVYRGFGPTLAAEYLRKKHGIEVSKETLRQWMIEAKLWRAKAEKVENPHVWRPRRSRFGELVQWDTSEHDWLEGRGEKLYLIAMIDDATSRLFARFVRHDTSVEMPPTQIGRGLRELGITWIAAHSPQAKGRVERNFQTAQDRLVKGMRVAGVKTLEEANQYLEQDYLAWWDRELTVEPSNSDNAHRPLDKSHNLAASLSHVETRQVENNYTLRFEAQLYQIERSAIVSGLRRATVRVEKRLDGSLAVRYGERYLPVTVCDVAEQPKASPPVKAVTPRRTGKGNSDWGKNFDLKKGPKVWHAAAGSGYRRESSE
jgi:hypothetical protein